MISLEDSKTVSQAGLLTTIADHNYPLACLWSSAIFFTKVSWFALHIAHAGCLAPASMFQPVVEQIWSLCDWRSKLLAMLPKISWFLCRLHLACQQSKQSWQTYSGKQRKCSDLLKHRSSVVGQKTNARPHVRCLWSWLDGKKTISPDSAIPEIPEASFKSADHGSLAFFAML